MPDNALTAQSAADAFDTKEWSAMQPSRIIIFVFLFTLVWVLPSDGQISSWIDENGVRHFSNVETSEDSETQSVKKMKEYQSGPSDEEIEHHRDRFQILRMYEQDRENEEKQKALEQELKAAEEKEQTEREAAEKEARERKRACAELVKKLDDLRHTKWEDYDVPDLTPAVCPDRRWKGARGKVFDNLRECIARQDKIRKSAYERAIRRQEEEIEKSCSQ